uniref:Uncharacterized protein n=1 Tax=Rhizophora mucronata TaxID=61149 RepID=A0A2P2P0E3_RHIMU
MENVLEDDYKKMSFKRWRLFGNLKYRHMNITKSKVIISKNQKQTFLFLG